MNKRLFISIDIPGDIKDRLLSECENNFTSSDWRFMKKDNLHITLAFIGSVDEERTYDISEAVEKITANTCPIEIGLKDISLGPPDGEKTMVWVKIANNQDLENLAMQIKDALIDCGFDALKKDYKRFSPHITIAKKRTPTKRLRNEAFQKINANEKFTAYSADLMESILSKDGSEYSIIRSFDFTRQNF